MLLLQALGGGLHVAGPGMCSSGATLAGGLQQLHGWTAVSSLDHNLCKAWIALHQLRTHKYGLVGMPCRRQGAAFGELLGLTLLAGSPSFPCTHVCSEGMAVTNMPICFSRVCAACAFEEGWHSLDVLCAVTCSRGLPLLAPKFWCRLNVHAPGQL